VSWFRVKQLRQVGQVLFFCLFVVLLFAGVEKQSVPPFVDFYFRFNPLSGIASMLASRQWIPRLGWGLVTMFLTLVVGRVWCGWICPMGSLLEWVSFKHTRKRAEKLPQGLRGIKYFLVLFILTAALFSNLTLLILDPLAIFTRTMTVTIIPAFVRGFNALERALYLVPGSSQAVDIMDSWLRGAIIPFVQPAFRQSVLIVLIFLSMISLNWLAPRFWCRYLCPLGALLGWFSRIAIFRPFIRSNCKQCTRCTLLCQPGAINPDKEGGYTIIASECTVCLDCLAGCNQGDIGFRSLQKVEEIHEYDLSRRQALGAMLTGVAGVLVLGSDLATHLNQPFLIRPPGVVDEEDFLSRCLRCAQCMKVCPTTALQPALLESGLQGLWTPLLVPRSGACSYGCTSCGQVCPSGAIPSLSIEKKRQQVLGKANIHQNRCLPWASNIPCIVCEEMCPVPQKAIHLEVVEVNLLDGSAVLLQKPHVIRELCIGCGICENKCPLGGEAAIKVYRE
jgi:polyferredoxin